MLRLKSDGRSGPVREVQAGSGYWSQNSPVHVLALTDLPTHLEIRWPGGRTITVALPEESLEIQVNPNGQVTKVR
jgi:hypothetical protein